MKSHIFPLCVFLGLLLSAGPSNSDESKHSEILKEMDSRGQHYQVISRKIWEFAEPGYQETKSAELLKSELRAAGFDVQEYTAGIPTAFVASWGSGKPVISIVGEYDALPGLSQQDSPALKPRVAGGYGHGCGHNLLGTASLFAAVTTRQYMEKKGLRGTVRYYGTPAEEGGSGKVYMARAGAFNDSDAVLAWHPYNRSHAGWKGSLAVVSARFRFRGIAAHAAAAPEAGRSALDAIMVMTHAVELLREHVPESTRIHYVISDGGKAPNVVPDASELYLYARHPQMPVLDGIWPRILKCAEAAALATETTVEFEIVSGTVNYLENLPLNALLDRNLREVGGIRYSAEEREFAEQIRSAFSATALPSIADSEKVAPPEEALVTVSSDVGDVSWIAPTGHLWAATLVPGVPLHTWQATACAGSSIGNKGMLQAAKTLALTAIDLLEQPELLHKASEDFHRRIADHPYRSLIPADQKPPLNYRDLKQ